MTRLRAAALSFYPLIFIATLSASACQKPALPEQGSAAEQLYREKCGRCHPAYVPRTLTAAMWSKQVDLMQNRMIQAGVTPLDSDERRVILDYLTRNAGSN